MRQRRERVTPVTHALSTAAGGLAAPTAAITTPWRDPSLPVPDRVADLLSRMTLAEKLAQLCSVWISGPVDGDGVAPLQGEFTTGMPPWGYTGAAQPQLRERFAALRDVTSFWSGGLPPVR